MELREMYEPSLMRGRDFKINDKITIHMPSVGDIIDYGEQKYFQLVYLFCSTSSSLTLLELIGRRFRTLKCSGNFL